MIRVVSDTLESNGSSSMGSVCASSMALQAAGVPVAAPGRRRRDGADQGGRRLHRPHRHRRRRGPPRRHGLQGRRLRGRDHRPADGHQDHRRHLRDPHRRARAGAQGPPVHPRQDGRGDRRPARAALRVRAGDRVDQDRPREDRRGHRQGRRDDPRHAGGVRGRDRHRGRRHGARLRAERRARRGLHRADRVDDQGGRDRRPVPRARSSRRPPSAPSSSWSRAPTACCTSRTSSPASGSRRSRACSAQGDEIDVTVAEVDKERGRIGLRLSDDPAIAGKTPEELQSSAPATRRWAAAAAAAAAVATAVAEAAAVATGAMAAARGRERLERTAATRR